MSLLINHITKKYEDSTALNNVSLEIKEGEFLAILGPSGCGKTTLLRIIGGFICPTDGEVKWNNELYSSAVRNVPVEKRNLSMVFQSFALWPHMTVREHVEFPLKSKRNQEMTKEEKKEAVNKAICAMGLEDYADRLPGELSGGQRQRVALARAIVAKPAILLMDEPLSALDAELKISMRKEIQDIHKITGATIIYVTHDQSEALAMADRIMIMKDGNIEQIGTPEEIYFRPGTEFVAKFVSKSNMFHGKWDDKGYFKVNDTLTFYRPNVDRTFIPKGICPLRPEELTVNREGQGMKAVILNKQYNGREIHYTVQSEQGICTIYTSNFQKFDEGENVIIRERNEAVESAG